MAAGMALQSSRPDSMTTLWDSGWGRRDSQSVPDPFLALKGPVASMLFAGCDG